MQRMPLALDEGQVEYLVAFRTFKNSSVMAAAKSLINYFRDVCPHMLPKNLRGRFSKIEDDGLNHIDKFSIYGAHKLNYNIDGIELLKRHEGVDEGVNLAADRILDENDLKKIKILKLK